MKLNSQLTHYRMIKLKKIKKKKRKAKLVIPINRPMDFLKFRTCFFLKNIFLTI
jgi:hypothetical protein